MSDEQIREFAEGSGLPPRTKKTLTPLSGLLEEIAKVRRNGFGIDAEGDVEGIFCVGAAIFDHFGKCIGAISAKG